MRATARLCFTILLSLTTVGAMAGPVVTNWMFDLTTVFDTTSVTWTNGTTNTSAADTELRWGTGNSGSSSLVITNSVITNRPLTTNTPPVATIGITHNNNPINGSTLRTANIFSTLTLTPDGGIVGSPSAPVGAPEQLTFGINFAETPNNGPIIDDVFVLSLGALNNAFDYDGNTYFVQTIPLTNQLGPIAPGDCAAAGASAPCIGWRTVEGQSTTERFGLSITTEPVRVPTPAPLGLLALGLLAMGAARRS